MSYKTIKTLTTWQPFLFKGNFIFNTTKTWIVAIVDLKTMNKHKNNVKKLDKN